VLGVSGTGAQMEGQVGVHLKWVQGKLLHLHSASSFPFPLVGGGGRAEGASQFLPQAHASL
jgi:hypothetical protein